jgi:uncharacterized protein YbjQ (UPF0145 family)
MSFPILTTTQYDATKYTPVGSVVLNRVEGISLLRNMFAGIGALFGGKNTLIQEAVDRLQLRSLTDFTAKVQATYPNTVQVVALHTDISEVGRDDRATFMSMTMSGTCLVPIMQSGGGRRNNNNDPEAPSASAFANSAVSNNPVNNIKKNNNTKRNNGRLTMNNLSTNNSANNKNNNGPLTMNNLSGGRRARKSKTRRSSRK